MSSSSAHDHHPARDVFEPEARAPQSRHEPTASDTATLSSSSPRPYPTAALARAGPQYHAEEEPTHQ
jgi:hypothetical protein